MKIISVKLYNEQYELINQYAKMKHITQSQVIRQAINEYIENHKGDMIYKYLPFETKRIKIYTYS
jgi:predicted DNA-binding protein